jgi:hypothetical protein
MKYGTRSDEVSRLQRKLNLTATGVFDELTEAAVKNFQIKNKLSPNGEVDSITYELLFESDLAFTTDASENTTELFIKYHLPKSEYIETNTKKEYIFLHHTAGWNDPYKQVDIWGKDDRGRLGTSYVIGGPNSKTGDTSLDGVVLQAFDSNYYAWHLGSVDSYMHKHSIGIEICNFGQLTKKGNVYVTYTGAPVKENQVVDLGYKFRGYQYWHRYSKDQIESACNLIKYLSDKHDIDYQVGLHEWLTSSTQQSAFEYKDNARHGEVKGLLSHSNVRKDKFDVSPQPELIDAILRL